MATGSDSNTQTTPAARVLGSCDARLWGLSSSERYRRAFARCGVELCTQPGDGQSLVLVRADYVLAEALIKTLTGRVNTVLVSTGVERRVLAAHAAPPDIERATRLVQEGSLEDEAAAGFEILTTLELGSNYNAALRKLAEPLALSLVETPRAEIEKRMFADVYKGATDLVTKWCWPVPARHVTRWAAECGIAPNTITTVSLVFVLLACWLFAIGEFLWGIPVAWFMTFLDTVDGKLARLTLTSSWWGNIYDHGIDLVHPPFWWWAWYHAVAVGAGGDPGQAVTLSFWLIVAGYVLGRVLEGIFLHGFGIQTHVWRPVDYWFRTITARRNPNLVILMVFALAGEPALGLVAVAAWTVLSILFHLVRLLQAFAVRLGGGTVQSWMTQRS